MRHEHGGNKRFYFGVILIVIGSFLILEKLDIIPWNVTDILISWQMIIIAIGAISVLGGNRTGGVIMIVVGTFFLLPDLFDIPREVKRIFWPVILVAVGVAMLMKHKGKRDEVIMGSQSPSVDYFDDFVIFGGREIFINSQHLMGGKATSIFGGIEYDLRRAVPSENGSVIDCVTIFGGCGFKIPPDWSVRNEVTTIFGAFTDKRGETYQQAGYDPSKTITIKGISIFGGVEIKHI
ncbi:MAG: DUF5668 domain-containing protein [Prolixibacteraceae bacterium]|jgi:predicted membrane protein|nr:DUF5668 domain-containing protein [Prolixibacteraceae bacterium]